MKKQSFILAISILGCAQSGIMAMEKPLLNDSESAWILIDTAKNNNLSHLELLLKYIEVDARTNQNNGTALMAASQAGHVAACKLLLDHGAMVDCISKAGRTALFFAANAETAQLLIEAGANANHVDSDCNASVLMWHACSERETICSLLMRAGADINYTDKDGNTALSWAVLNNRQSTCELLVKKMLSLPDDTQKLRIYTFLACLRNNADEAISAAYTPCVVDTMRIALSKMVMQENMINIKPLVNACKDTPIKQHLLQKYFSQ